MSFNGEASVSDDSALYTPVLKLSSSRKRKLTEMREPGLETSLLAFPNRASILSSTLNESISSQLENLNPFHVESSFEGASPRLPTTPSKRNRFGFKLPPSGSPKLGSPERHQILYPSLNRTSKRRLHELKRASPAKKQLFNSAAAGNDPVRFFCHVKNCDHVVEKIFRALDERDLYQCSRVSKCWKTAVMNFEKVRFETYRNNRIMNKENYNASPNWMLRDSCSKQSTPIATIYERTNSLTKGQHLQHCQGCNRPTAIVQQQISQCSRELCGYIVCLRCNSFSATGPEHFSDSCKNAVLVYERPRRQRPGLLDSPRKFDGSVPFFLQDASHSTLNSSGYGTELDLSSSRRGSGSFLKDRSHTLKSSNADAGARRVSDERRPSPVVPVVAVRDADRLEPDLEPSSPPKVKNHPVGSKKSKRALRRL